MSNELQDTTDARWAVLHEQVMAMRAAAPALAASLSHAQLNWQPELDRWSIGQNLQHVVLTGRDYIVPLDAAIAEARQRTAAGMRPYRPGFVGAWLVRSQEPPVTRRLPTLRRLQPPSSLERDLVLAEFDAFHQELERRIHQARGAHLDAGRMHSPLLRLIRLTVAQAIAGLLGHARRHLWQAEQVRARAGFPG